MDRFIAVLARRTAEDINAVADVAAILFNGDKSNPRAATRRALLWGK